MARRRSDQDRDLQGVYDQIPPVACRGLCAQSCGPIDASARETQRLRARGVRLVPRAQALRELAATGSYRCSVHEDRPTICRLWGAQQSMACPYGCRPEQGLLDDATGLQLLVQSLHAGGDNGQLGDGPLPTPQAIADAMSTPAVRHAVHDLLHRTR